MVSMGTPLHERHPMNSNRTKLVAAAIRAPSIGPNLPVTLEEAESLMDASSPAARRAYALLFQPGIIQQIEKGRHSLYLTPSGGLYFDFA